MTLTGLNKKALWLIRLAGLALFAVILSKIDLRQTLAVISGTRFSWIAAVAVSYAIFLIAKAIRWIVIYRCQGLRMKLADALRAYFFSSSLAMVTVGQAADFLKAFALKKFSAKTSEGKPDQITLGEAGVSVVLERLLDLGLYLPLALICLVFILVEEVQPLMFYSFGLLVALYLAAVYLLTVRSGRLIRRLDRPEAGNPGPAGWVVRNLRGLLQGMHDYPAGALAVPLALTCLNVMVLALGDFFLAKSLSVQIPYHHFLFISPLIGIANILPITVAGFGTRELAVIYCFSNYGIAPERAIAFSLAYFSLSYLILLLLGLLSLIPQYFRGTIRAD